MATLKTSAPGVGGPRSLFRGKDRSRQLTVLLTPSGHELLTTLRRRLAKANPDAVVSVADTMEWALREATDHAPR
jgi:hypothetical protein